MHGPTAAPRLLLGILCVRNILRRQRGLTNVHQQGLSGTREQLQPDLPGIDEIESSRCSANREVLCQANAFRVASVGSAAGLCLHLSRVMTRCRRLCGCLRLLSSAADSQTVKCAQNIRCGIDTTISPPGLQSLQTPELSHQHLRHTGWSCPPAAQHDTILPHSNILLSALGRYPSIDAQLTPS